ncbi:hypothetical protein DIPPA_16959 [Diplonema papillatum]|nr:hypothetical protein DIPPA_16959 [Diplonema papillatum]
MKRFAWHRDSAFDIGAELSSPSPLRTLPPAGQLSNAARSPCMCFSDTDMSVMFTVFPTILKQTLTIIVRSGTDTAIVSSSEYRCSGLLIIHDRSANFFA